MEWLGIDRRRLGTAMLAFGLAGLALAAVVGVALVGGGIAARNLDDQIVAAQGQLGASLTRLTLTMDSAAATVNDASATLATSRDGVAHAADTLGQVADTANALAGALDVTILGNQPFRDAAAGLRDLEAQIRVFQTDATKLAVNLDQNAGDATTIADEVRDMRSQVGDLAGAVTAFSKTREIVSFAVGGMLLAALLTLWQAILAGAIAWAGWHLRRPVTEAASSARTEGAVAADADAPPA
jgi:hypothetical protein